MNNLDQIRERALLEAESIDNASELYERGKELEYGVSGALGDEWLRYPHEIEGEANCYEQAVFLYSIADAAEMNPRFFEIYDDNAEMSHGFIDVEDGGETVLVDPFQNMAGKPRYHPFGVEVEGIDDNELSYKGIRQLSFDEALDTIKKYREDPAKLFDTSQKIREGDLENGSYEERLETDTDGFKLLSFLYPSDIAGFHHHGAIKDLDSATIDFFDFETKSWGDVSGQNMLTENGEPKSPEQLSDDSIHQIARFMAYKDRRNDGRIFSEEELDEFWNDYRENMVDKCQPATVYRGRQAIDNLEFLEESRSEEPERFYNKMDWLNFLKKSEDFEEVDSELVDSYLDIHRELLDQVEDPELDQRLENAVEKTRDFDEPVGNLQFEWDSYQTVQRAVSENDRELMNQIMPLLMIDDEAYSYAISEGSEDITEELDGLLNEERKYDFYDESWCKWEIDRDLKKAVRRERVGEDEFSTLDSFIELHYSFAVDGDLEPSKLIFYDSLPYSDDRIVHLEKNTSTFNFEFEDIEDEIDRIVELNDPSELDLWAPEPRREFNLLTDEAAMIALMSTELVEGPLFHTEEEINDYAQNVISNLEYHANRNSLLPSLVQDSEKSLEALKDHKDDFTVMENNRIREYKDSAEELHRIIDDELTQEEQYRNYLSTFLYTADEMMTAHKDQEEELIEDLEEGYLQSLPSQQTVEDQAANRDDSLGELFEAIDSAEPLDNITSLLSEVKSDDFGERGLDTAALEMSENPDYDDKDVEMFELFRNLARI